MVEFYYKHTIKEVLDSCPEESGHFSPDGDFAWHGELESALLPGLTIPGFDAVGLPLSDREASLLAQVI